MSRRDAIIIAVLINAGLLIVLFITARTSDEGRMEDLSKQSVVQQQVVPAQPGAPLAATSAAANPASVAVTAKPAQPPVDEVDQMLRRFAEEQGGGMPSVAQAETTQLAAAQPEAVAEVKAEVEEAVGTVEKKAASAAYTEVTVKRGDYLDKIAKNHGTTVKAIMKLNHLSGTQLKIGQKLKIPATPSKVAKKSSAASVTASEKKTVGSGDSQFYTIKAGDNPWLIATRHKMKVEDLLKLNNMDAETARRLKPGDKLRVK